MNAGYSGFYLLVVMYFFRSS